MLALSSIILVWGIVLIALGASLVGFSIWFLNNTRQMKKRALKEIEQIGKLTQNKFNKIATLSVDEFDSYMTKIFSMCMEIASTEKVSERDPGAAEVLYAETLKNFIVYIGEETLHAIDYYYGKDYIYRWCETRYRLMNNRGHIAKVVNKEFNVTLYQNQNSGTGVN